jgi:hypothetical protein
MPNVRKLNHEEVRTIERKTLGLRRATEAEYDAFVRDFMPGDYGEAVLEPNEKRLTVRSRLKAAGGRHQPPLQLTFLRTRNADVVRFKVSAAEGASADGSAAEEAPEPERAAPSVQAVSTDAPPATGRRGRPRKSAASGEETAAPARRKRQPRTT